MNQKNRDLDQPIMFETAYLLLLKERNAGFLDDQTSKPAETIDNGDAYDHER
jgi:hypothetical protein